MTSILALDTSTEACSVALLHAGETREDFAIIPRQHAAELLPRVEKLLSDSGVSLSALDAIAFGRGPGSFTGLRIAAGVTQGLAFGLDIPVLPVSTLAALAWQSYQENGIEYVLGCLDARIEEVYWGAFSVNDEGVSACSEEQLCRPEAMDINTIRQGMPTAGMWSGAGNGWQFREAMPSTLQALLQRVSGQELPRAFAIARLGLREYREGRAISAELAAPIYLRDKVTHN